MKTSLEIMGACFVFSIFSSCGDRERTAASEDATPPPQMKRIVSVLQSDGWANTPRAVALIEEYAKEIGLEITIERTVIKTDEDVREHRFIGSPTVRINGLDVDPTARDATQFGFTWRLLNWTQGASATEKMLHDAFIEAGWIDQAETTKGSSGSRDWLDPVRKGIGRWIGAGGPTEGGIQIGLAG